MSKRIRQSSRRRRPELVLFAQRSYPGEWGGERKKAPSGLSTESGRRAHVYPFRKPRREDE